MRLRSRRRVIHTGRTFDSQLEADYESELARQCLAKAVVAYKHHPIRFIIGGRWDKPRSRALRYTADFEVHYADHVEYHEVKGSYKKRGSPRIRVPAQLKQGLSHIRVAAMLYPGAAFILVTRDRGRWVKTRVLPK